MGTEGTKQHLVRSSAFYFILVLQGIRGAVLVKFTCLRLLLQADCSLKVLYLKLQALLKVLTYSFKFYMENPMQVRG